MGPSLLRERFRITLVIVVLMGMHAALVLRAHADSNVTQLMLLAAYCGGLSAFIGAIGVGSAWHLQGAQPGARFVHVVAAAWLVTLLGALLAVMVAWGTAQFSTPTERTLGAAWLSCFPAAYAATRLTQPLLSELARRAGTTVAVSPSWALGLAAALASGTFGALHPWVRFPASLPATDREVYAYGWTAVVVTCTLLPMAGWRMMRGMRVSGVLLKAPVAPMLPAVLGVLAMALGLTAMLLQPFTWWDWSIYRLVSGVVLGSVGIVMGACQAADEATT